MTYIEYLEYLLKMPIDSGIREDVRKLPVRSLARFREDYHVAWAQFRAHVLEAGKLPAGPEVFEYLAAAPRPYDGLDSEEYQFRPILHGRYTAAAVFGGDESHPWESSDDGRRIDRLKRYLLYAHRIVLPDPVWYIMQYLSPESQYVAGQEEDGQFVAKSRAALSNFLFFLHRIRSLVDANIVSFYPQYEHTGVGFPDHVFKDTKFCDWYRASDLYDGDEISGPILFHNQIIELLFYTVRNNASCLVDNPRLLPVLDCVIRYVDFSLRDYPEGHASPVKAKERAVLNTLAEARLPTLESISLDDIVRVRQDSVGFNEWRKAFGDAVQLIESSREDALVVRSAIDDSIAGGREKLRKEVEQSPFLSAVKDQGAKLVLGSTAIGALIGKLAGVAFNPVATGAAATSAALLVVKDWMKARRKHADRAALLRHYTVWHKD